VILDLYKSKGSSILLLGSKWGNYPGDGYFCAFDDVKMGNQYLAEITFLV